MSRDPGKNRSTLGHDFAGRALWENGVAINLSQMRAVTIAPDRRAAQIEDLIEAAQKYGLATTTGTVSSVGMGADNLLSAQVVTADGQLVTDFFCPKSKILLHR